MTSDLLVAKGYPDARELREMYGKQLPDRALRQIHFWQLFMFDKLARENATFPVKTHTAPSISIKAYLRTGRFKATYTYRDPRDVILSSIERGKEMHDRGDAKRYFVIGPYRTFARLQTLEGTIKWMKYQQLPRLRRWLKCNNTLITKYEDVQVNTFSEMHRLADFLELKVTDELVADIVEKYRPSENTPKHFTTGGGNLFNKGVIGRFRETMSQKEQDLCYRHLGKDLEELGYGR